MEYIDQRDLDCDCIERMCNLASGIALLIVFISSRSDIKEVGDKIKAWLPMNTKFMMISTGGEVCKREGIASIYCTDEIGRKKMVLQSFSNRMIKNSQIFTIPLPNEDLLKKIARDFLAVQEPKVTKFNVQDKGFFKEINFISDASHKVTIFIRCDLLDVCGIIKRQGSIQPYWIWPSARESLKDNLRNLFNKGDER